MFLQKYLAGRKEESESEEETSRPGTNEGSLSKAAAPVLSFLTSKEIIRRIEKEEILADAPSEILKGIATRIHP